jgi:hypothetical protein
VSTSRKTWTQFLLDESLLDNLESQQAWRIKSKFSGLGHISEDRGNMVETDSESNATLKSALKLSEPAQYREAAIALLITVLFTTAPTTLDMLYYIWVGVVQKNAPSFLTYVYNNDLRHGELSLYSTALLAPVFFSAFRKNRLPGNALFLLVTVGALVVSTFVFVIVRGSQIANEAAIFQATLFIFFITMSTLYVATVVQSPPSANKIAHESEASSDTFRANFHSFREKK